MVKHTQTIRWQQLANCLSVFNYFVGLALKVNTPLGITIHPAHIGVYLFLISKKLSNLRLQKEIRYKYCSRSSCFNFFEFWIIAQVGTSNKCDGLADWTLCIIFKACVRYFVANFIFHQMIALQKLWKMFFISSKKLFSFLRYLNFFISIFPSFSPCQPFL